MKTACYVTNNKNVNKQNANQQQHASYFYFQTWVVIAKKSEGHTSESISPNLTLTSQGFTIMKEICK